MKLRLTSHAQRVCGQHPLRVLQRFFARQDSEWKVTQSQQSVSTLLVGNHSPFPPQEPNTAPGGLSDRLTDRKVIAAACLSDAERGEASTGAQRE